MPDLPSDRRAQPGSGRHLGCTPDGAGANIAVWAPHATAVQVCLFDQDGTENRVTLPQQTSGVWHGYLPGMAPGQLYGFRAEGPWSPAEGRLFNVDKLLLDPYARAITGGLTPNRSLAAVTPAGEPNPGDTAAFVPRSVVVGDDAFDWGDEQRPDVPWRRTVIYEAHVKGLTWCQPAIPARQRGSYAGLGHPAMMSHLKELGVTSLELLPVQHFLTEPEISRRGQTNYWGYNPIGFFAPHAAYSSAGTHGEQVREFKEMVRSLHGAGIEVLLDVVYNHTAEGPRTGPSVCFRGFDDAAYYRSDRWGRYADVTGCGNTLDLTEPQVLRLVMDSLRYWVNEMHVDGFRFDLAPALSRTEAGLDARSNFLAAAHQDPVIRDVKLIAEPWDATSEGYSLGGFPPDWREWNDRFRDATRDFWAGQPGGVRELAFRLSGSSDLYAARGRLPSSSINYVTCHDGFTLRDLVSYAVKHNQANGEAGRDGSDANRSWNCGVEGETDDPAIIALRRRQAANLIATVLVSTGVPMFAAGDELGRTQLGNNNAFCQDNETSWLHWEASPEWLHLEGLVSQLLRLRADHPVLRRRHFFTGSPVGQRGRKDVTWLREDGAEMRTDDWHDPARLTLGVFLAGDELDCAESDGHDQPDASYLIWLHAGARPTEVALPQRFADSYVEVLRTDHLDAPVEAVEVSGDSVVTLPDHCFAMFAALDQAETTDVTHPQKQLVTSEPTAAADRTAR